MVLIHKGNILRGDFSDQTIAAGDTLIVHGLWNNMAEMKATGDFLLATPVSADSRDRSKTWIATLCFALAIGLSLAGFPISMALLSGAVAMVLTGVLGMEDAYQAADWKVVFFLAGLIPLGVAMQKRVRPAFWPTRS
ncbi:MAG: SLC13 family permease [Thermodesulfobacteriota bacterium]